MSPSNTRAEEGLEQPQQVSPCQQQAASSRLRPFKNKKSLAERKTEVAAIRSKFPTKIPIIVDRYNKEKSLNPLDKTKFLVPQEITMSQFVTIIRNRMQLSPQQALYLLVNNHSMASLSRTLAEVYQEHKDEDGFLYITYASQETFG
ncbi:microtubule-associated proteins 1A/1B light chain 3A-like [Neocloeon triangulifer]|uniref:microtubule-associated proteins 1A/1B light chain 3A-like n=1 Tax=Neocloeon triangulifer TaxID=2078957 RepID=UPI00286F8087|nr:microtubule-associated proteins 1A/1B light chain 3A-like [Neocloeon triangulifer]